MSRSPRSSQRGAADSGRPTRELPEYLRHWDGLPSKYHEHRLAYLAPAPLPPELMKDGGTTPRRTGHHQSTTGGKGSSKKSGAGSERVAELLEPADDPACVSAADVNAILAFVARGFEREGRLLDTLQDDVHKSLQRAEKARERKEQQREHGDEPHDDDEHHQGRATDGDDAEKSKSAENDGAERHDAAAAGRDETNHDDDVRQPQPPAAQPGSGRQSDRMRMKRYQPPLAKPRPVEPGPDGKVEFMPGIDSHIRYNMGQPKVPKARVMSLPWNRTLLSEEEQEAMARREFKGGQRRERQAVEAEESDGRGAITREQRHFWRQINAVARDEHDAVATLERKRAARRAAKEAKLKKKKQDEEDKKEATSSDKAEKKEDGDDAAKQQQQQASSSTAADDQGNSGNSAAHDDEEKKSGPPSRGSSKPPSANENDADDRGDADRPGNDDDAARSANDADDADKRPGDDAAEATAADEAAAPSAADGAAVSDEAPVASPPPRQAEEDDA